MHNPSQSVALPLLCAPVPRSPLCSKLKISREKEGEGNTCESLSRSSALLIIRFSKFKETFQFSCGKAGAPAGWCTGVRAVPEIRKAEFVCPGCDQIREKKNKNKRRLWASLHPAHLRFRGIAFRLPGHTADFTRKNRDFHLASA